MYRRAMDLGEEPRDITRYLGLAQCLATINSLVTITRDQLDGALYVLDQVLTVDRGGEQQQN